jgi:hypothetical protein
VVRTTRVLWTLVAHECENSKRNPRNEKEGTSL